MKNKLIRRMTIDAIFIAIILIVGLVPNIGFITIGPIAITYIHVFVILGAMLFGVKEGLLFGFTFGIASLIQAAITGGGNLPFVHPMISIFPRVCFGGLAGLLFDLSKKIKEPRISFIAVSFTSVFSAIFHSVLTLSCYNLFASQIVGDQGLVNILSTLLLPNVILEFTLAFVVPTGLMIPLFNALGDSVNNPFKDYKLYYSTKGYTKTIRPYRKDMVKTLKDLISINSVYDENSVDEKNPFGKGVSAALNYIDQLAKRDGFISTNYDNKIVEILYGEGDKNITIMAHADVVPVTGHTKRNLFKLYRRNFTLYGRGVSDDKGPFVAAYYALKALRDNNLISGYQVRILVGGNEESGSKGMHYYFNELKKPQPTFGFSPDSDFPLTHAEKGIFNFVIDGEIDIDGIDYIKGGVASNAVIDEVIVKCNNELTSEYILKEISGAKKETINNENIIKVFGVAAHGSMPEKGVNAALILFEKLAKISKNAKFVEFFELIKNTDASGLSADGYSDTMGYNTLNLGLINYENGHISLTMNYRYVDGYNEENLKEKIVESLKDYDVKFSPSSHLLYYPLDHILVKTLMQSYQKETGDYHSLPMAIGGGTYAKEANNVLAFGMQFPGVDTKMHESGEFLPLVALYKGASVYARTILDLGELINSNENEI